MKFLLPRYIFTVLLFCLSINSLPAQQGPGNTRRNWEVGILQGYHYAPNVVESTGASMNGWVTGADITWLQHGFFKPQTDSIYGNAELALNTRLLIMNKPDTFGVSIGFLPSLTLWLNHYKRNHLGIRMAYGINLNNATYHHDQNFDNRAVSSNVNFGLDLALTDRLFSKSGTSYTFSTGLYHVSNGSLKMPNGGINIIYGKIGITMFSKPNNMHYLQSDLTRKAVKPWLYQVYGFAAYKQMGYFDDVNSFWVYGLCQQYLHQFNALYALGGGLDLFYDATQPLLNTYGVLYSDVPEKDKYFAALGIYNKFSIQRIFLPLGVYRYLNTPNTAKEPVYIRFGLGTELSQHLFCGLFFKGTLSNGTKLQSDFMEWSLGARF